MEESGIISNICFNKGLRLCSRALRLPTLSITLLLCVEACGEAANSLYVKRSAIIEVLPKFRNGYVSDLIRQLVADGYLSQTGGKASPFASPNRHCFNKAQYCLTSEGKLVIRYFHKKYAELMKLPITCSYKGGFPRGMHRVGNKGILDVPEGYVRSNRAQAQYERRHPELFNKS